MWRFILIVAMLLAGCAQLPPTPQDIQGKKFDAVPDKAVIYIVRPRVDSHAMGSVAIGDSGTITTHQGTYYRWEATPGTQHIQASGPWMASVTVNAEAGKIYFVEQTVQGSLRFGTVSMSLQQVDERRGRKLVMDAQSI
jgi:hypothetical protein